MPGKGITSVTGFLGALHRYAPSTAQEVFFRGHEDRSYTLTPSIFRNRNLLNNENAMFMELLISNPEDFKNDETTLDKLVRMQHYELPTRLLDLTTNPLIALYFACLGSNTTDGEVFVFRIERDKVRFFDSPTVTVLANLARLTNSEKAELRSDLPREEFAKLRPVTKLCAYAGSELPGFTSNIDPSDLNSFTIVRSKMSNARIAAQSGAFIIGGLSPTISSIDGATIDKIRVDDDNKEKILSELRTINVDEQTVYPAIEKSAKVIRKKYEQ